MANIYNDIDNNIITFNNKSIVVILDEKDMPWFHAVQVAESLGSKNPNKTIKDVVPQKYKMEFKQIKGTKPKFTVQPMSNFINESGLYVLLLKTN